MNVRKFLFLFSSIIIIFLFILGSVFLVSTKFLTLNNNSSLLGDILKSGKSDMEPLNFLVLGGDRVNSNTDTIILVNLNPQTGKISMLSIPRDTNIEVPGSSLPKVNSAYAAGGGKLAAETVSKLLNARIKYYVFIDTDAFRQMIDILNGVDFYVPVDMYYEDPTQDLYINLKKGMQKMNGEKAEQFMRFRQPLEYNNEIMQFYDGGDLKRINAQQDFIKEIIKQKATLKYITKADDIINVIFKNLDTNLPMDEAVRFSQVLTKINTGEMQMFTLPGTPVEDGYWFYNMDKSKADSIIKSNFQSKSGIISGSTKPTSKPVTTQKPEPIITTTPTIETPKPTVTTSPLPTPKSSSTPNTSVSPGSGP